jgi:hypothetical protein
MIPIAAHARTKPGINICFLSIRKIFIPSASNIEIYVRISGI